MWKRKIIMTNKGKPFIKWVGGKTQLIDSIENTLPKDFETRQDLTYIEPFVGGGAILFWILQKYPNIKKAVINDINPDLTTAYKTIKENPKESWEAFISYKPKELDNELNRLAWADTLPYLAPNPATFDKKVYEQMALFMKQNKLIETLPSLDEYAQEILK